MISKLLRVCRYTPTEKEFQVQCPSVTVTDCPFVFCVMFTLILCFDQLADLRPYLAHMRPSSLQRVVSSSYSALPEEDDDMDMLDQRVRMC